MPGSSYRDLNAWQESRKLVAAVYRLATTWPKDEVFGLVAQAKRAAVSIPANFAEGQGRSTEKDFMRYLDISYGSLMELETHLQLAQDLGFTSDDNVAPLLKQCGVVGRLINGLARALHRSDSPAHTSN